MKKKTINATPNTTKTVIHGVEYIVRSFFDETAKETAEQKLIRLLTEATEEQIKSSVTQIIISK